MSELLEAKACVEAKADELWSALERAVASDSDFDWESAGNLAEELEFTSEGLRRAIDEMLEARDLCGPR